MAITLCKLKFYMEIFYSNPRKKKYEKISKNYNHLCGKNRSEIYQKKIIFIENVQCTFITTKEKSFKLYTMSDVQLGSRCVAVWSVETNKKNDKNMIFPYQTESERKVSQGKHIKHYGEVSVSDAKQHVEKLKCAKMIRTQ